MIINFIFSAKEVCGYLSLILLLSFTASQEKLHAETPENFAHQFADFKFSFHAEVQDPRIFVATKSGDCDDFATLAADTLTRSGYAPRLYAIRMKGETHVVCYIPEAKGYLDYNMRASDHPLVPCENSLQDISNKVALSFNREWISSYEFSYREKTKWLVNNIVKNRQNNLLAIR